MLIETISERCDKECLLEQHCIYPLKLGIIHILCQQDIWGEVAVGQNMMIGHHLQGGGNHRTV